MTFAAFAGLGSGALHAVTGPDHVLSLAPLSARAGRRAWRLGLRWGAGHALGTFAIAILAYVALGSQHAPLLARWGDLVAAFALIGMGVAGLRRQTAAQPTGAGPFTVGVLHGAAGGAAVVAMVPAVVPLTVAHATTFLLAFAIGSIVAMAAFTRVLGSLGRALPTWRGVPVVTVAACSLSVVVGAAWLVAALS